MSHYGSQPRVNPTDDDLLKYLYSRLRPVSVQWVRSLIIQAGDTFSPRLRGLIQQLRHMAANPMWIPTLMIVSGLARPGVPHVQRAVLYHKKHTLFAQNRFNVTVAAIIAAIRIDPNLGRQIISAPHRVPVQRFQEYVIRGDTLQYRRFNIMSGSDRCQPGVNRCAANLPGFSLPHK